MPTLLDYLGVFRIQHWSLTLPYGSPNLPDKMDFWAFLCLSLKFSLFFSSQNLIFFYSLYGSWDLFVFLINFSHWQRLFRLYNLIVCISCNTSYNVLSHSDGVGEGVAGGWHLGTIKRASRFKISRGWHLWKWEGGGGMFQYFLKTAYLQEKKD